MIDELLVYNLNNSSGVNRFCNKFENGIDSWLYIFKNEN